MDKMAAAVANIICCFPLFILFFFLKSLKLCPLSSCCLTIVAVCVSEPWQRHWGWPEKTHLNGLWETEGLGMLTPVSLSSQPHRERLFRTREFFLWRMNTTCSSTAAHILDKAVALRGFRVLHGGETCGGSWYKNQPTHINHTATVLRCFHTWRLSTCIHEGTCCETSEPWPCFSLAEIMRSRACASISPYIRCLEDNSASWETADPCVCTKTRSVTN